MARHQGGATSSKEKEVFWKKTLAEWQHSGMSQAEFCRMSGLKANRFSSWKTLLLKREAGRSGLSHKRIAVKTSNRPSSTKAQGTADTAPQFVRLAIDDAFAVSNTTNNNMNAAAETVADINMGIVAAEIFMPTTSCRVRIFNGACPSTLSALVAALALT